MKKLLILLFSLLFTTLVFSSPSYADSMGGKEVTYLQDRNGIKYEVNSDVGFTGKHVEYYKNGEKFFEKNYKNGKKDGLMTDWDKEGNVTKTKTYKDGELVK